ncbi:MAG: hypothetical protein L3K09_00480 [Thermoplasmata archaeon]|nr:hypothetical protein [Thermoplasmata archaeon]
MLHLGDLEIPNGRRGGGVLGEPHAIEGALVGVEGGRRAGAVGFGVGLQAATGADARTPAGDVGEFRG